MHSTGPHLRPMDSAADGTERLSADDQATQREGQFLAAALARQRQAATVSQGRPGWCTFCAERCLPLAVYCDDECRADDEHRRRILARQGRVR